MKDNQTIVPELKVSDFKKSLELYTKVFGFKVLYDRPEHDFAMLQIGNSRLMVEGVNTKSRTIKVGELAYPFGRGINFQIQVENVDEVYEKVKNSEAKIFLDMEDRWYRVNDIEVGNKQFWVQDLDGYLLRFFQDLGDR